ncbi:hypothetical protein G6F43_005649 [Rhizopus delemar]|nr:hypothetical protein G6F43_005649 [Rhizopus delemar]
MVFEASHIETISVLDVKDAIHVGYNLTDYIASTILSSVPASNYCIVTDTNLAPLYLSQLMKAFQDRMHPSQRLLTRIMAAGETSKSRQMKASIEDYMLSESCTRDTCMIALGGGVIGDLVGYTASTFMRGVPFVQIPTTLLAMVDSSIGGKTAIDTPHGKNLIGTFWQPRFIFMDLSMLQTLPKRELANGMAEVIKTAAISSPSEFERLENGKQIIESVILGSDKNSSTDEEKSFVASVISASAKFKADVVTQDERESGLRGLLNFGHSIGHALEAVLAPTWLHGECISIGLILEAELACVRGHCSVEVVDRLSRCLELYGLPTTLDKDAKSKLTLGQVMTTLKVDKKNKGSQKRIVLLSEIGKTLEPKASDVPDDDILQVLSKHLPPAASIAPTLTEKSEIHFNLPNMTLVFDQVSCSPHLLTALETRYDYQVQQEYGEVQCTPKEVSDQKSTKTIYIHLTRQAGTSTSKDEYSSSYEYVVLEEQDDDQFCEGLLTFIDTVLQTGKSRHVNRKKGPSSFVTPTIADYKSVLPAVLNQWLENADAIEFRVDYLLDRASEKEWIACAGTQLAYLRLKTKLPVIFTVRTIPQAGQFDPKLTKLYTDLVFWAHRWGCDYVDLELTTVSINKLEDVMMLNYHYSSTVKLIGSFHDPEHHCPWSGNKMKEVYNHANRLFEYYNHHGVIKLVGFAEQPMDNIELEQFRHQVDPLSEKELILINMGAKGKFSRVANQFLTPATHPALPSAAAPGQLSIEEIVNIRHQLAMD